MRLLASLFVLAALVVPASACDYSQAAFGCAPHLFRGEQLAPAYVPVPKAPRSLAPIYVPLQAAPVGYGVSGGFVQQDTVERRGLFGRRISRTRIIFR